MQSDISMAYWVTGHEIVPLYSTQICFPCFVGFSWLSGMWALLEQSAF